MIDEKKSDVLHSVQYDAIRRKDVNLFPKWRTESAAISKICPI